jgi:hypothetical protein
VRNIQRPDFHEEWLAKQSIVTAEPTVSIMIAIRSKIGTPYLDKYCCRVRHPNGKTYEALDDVGGGGHTFFFNYPSHFEGAAPPVTGKYEIVWRLPGKSGKLREALRHSETITVE